MCKIKELCELIRYDSQGPDHKPESSQEKLDHEGENKLHCCVEQISTIKPNFYGFETEENDEEEGDLENMKNIDNYFKMQISSKFYRRIEKEVIKRRNSITL
jgi:hypothetical protein